MKAVLISIRPKWCELIANGNKTIEVRKTKPNLAPPFKVYIYATCNSNPRVILAKEGKAIFVADYRTMTQQANGKVIGEFVCDRIEEIGFSPEMHGKYICRDQSFIKRSCIPFAEMFDYLGELYGYGWHISDLKIYDKPRALCEFSKYGFDRFVPLKRPPQSWCYIDERTAVK